jgi:Family of unknown function (DUF6074)
MRPSCLVIPFPAKHRFSLIKSLAWEMASNKPTAAERILVARLDAQRRAMVRKGVQGVVIDRELRALEYAVRGELWTITLYGGDAA